MECEVDVAESSKELLGKVSSFLKRKLSVFLYRMLPYLDEMLRLATTKIMTGS